MNAVDTLRFSRHALLSYRSRSALMLLAMIIAVASVVLLTGLGESARQYVIKQFSALGTNLLIVLPGRSETTGALPPLLGATPRDLTLDDANSLYRSNHVLRVAPIVVGSAPVSYRQLEREVTVVGSTAEYNQIRELNIAQGSFLPAGEFGRYTSVCVLGHVVKTELFGHQEAIGQWLRINDRRFRVIGVLAPMGESLGLDIGELVLVPASAAQALFNTESLFRILVQAKTREGLAPAKADILAMIRQRHEGEDDITVITQDALLSTFDRILRALTYTVGGIAAISLAVAGILIMNIMLISVAQRRTEIGLLKALGAGQREILRIFLTEASLLSLTGAALGIAVALACIALFNSLWQNFSYIVPPWALTASLLIALITGIVFGLLPAYKAARLDPVQALSRR